MLPILHIGPLALQTPGLILLVGLWLGLDLSERHALRDQRIAGRIYHLAMISLIAGVVGARLGYAAQYPAAFLKSPLGLLSLSPQMLDPLVGILAAALALLIYVQRKGLPLLAVLDVFASLLAVLAVAAGFANLASGDAFGAPASLPWSIDLWGARRHPTQVYQILAALGVLAIIWPAPWNPIARRLFVHPGVRFWLFLALSALTRILVETYRGDSLLVLDRFRQAQLLAWLLLAVSLWQIGRQVFRQS